MKRVAVVTQNEPLYMPIFFRQFLPRVDDVTIERVTVLDLLNDSKLGLAKRMLNFYGLINFMRLTNQYMSRTITDRLGFGRHSVHSVSKYYGIPVEERNNINSQDYISWVEDANIDIILSISAPQVFENNLLQTPNEYCLNVHTSELPKYRGMLPTFWALFHGEDEIGCTVHSMAPEIDKGLIVNQTTFPILSDNSLDEVIRRGKSVGGVLAAKTLNEVAKGTPTFTEMTGDESYFSFPTIEDRKEFERRGFHLL